MATGIETGPKKDETNTLPNFGNFGASFAYDTPDELVGYSHFLSCLRGAGGCSALLLPSGPQLTSSQCGQSCRTAQQMEEKEE
jgi:hypothetical protein